MTQELKELSKFLGVSIPDLQGGEGEKGDRGEKGNKGEDGKDGVDGKDGKDGKNGRDGKQGKKGDKGEKGKDGRDGKDGEDGKDISPAKVEKITDELKTLKEKIGKDRKKVSTAMSTIYREPIGIRSITGTSHNDSNHAKHRLILCDCTSNAITVNLQPAIQQVGIVYIKKTDSSANEVTVDANGSETIDGAGTKTISAQYVTITLISDRNNWHIA